MTDFKTFCEQYGLDPRSQEARDEYAEALENLKALYSAASKAETSEAIERAASSSRER